MDYTTLLEPKTYVLWRWRNAMFCNNCEESGMVDCGLCIYKSTRTGDCNIPRNTPQGVEYAKDRYRAV